MTAVSRRRSRAGTAFAMLALCLASLPMAVRADAVSIVAFNVESDNSSDYVIGEQLAASHDIDLWVLTEVWDHKWPGRLADAARKADGMPYERILGTSGGGNRVLLLYRPDRLRLVDTRELTDIPHGKREAAPLVARFADSRGREFEVVGVHLSKGESRRAEQARALNRWAAGRDVPAVAAGTFYFDLPIGDAPDSVEALAALTAAGQWRWITPRELVPTRCERGGRLNDFVFVSGGADGWTAEAEIMFRQSNYCRDSDRTSGYRPVLARFAPTGASLERGSVPERTVSPLLPGVVFVRDTDGDGVPDARAEPGRETPPAEPAAGEAPAMAPEASAAPDAAPAAASPADEDARQKALEERLEALEREAEALRRELEAEGGD